MLSSGWSQVGFIWLDSGDAYQEEQPTNCTAIHLPLICWGRWRWWARWGRSAVGLKWVAKAAVLPLASKDMASVFSYLHFAWYVKNPKRKRQEKTVCEIVCLWVVGGVIALSAGLQGWECGSDIRQHAKLQGHPQRWNCRWLIDRLLETKPVQIASHFHAPTLLTLHQGESKWLGETHIRECMCACVWVGMLLRVVQTSDPLGKWMSLSQSSAHVDSTFSHMYKYTHKHTHIYI